MLRPDDFAELIDAFADEAQEHRARAEMQAMRSLDATSIAAARQVIETVLADKGRGFQEGIADMEDVRRAVEPELLRDLSQAQQISRDVWREAIIAGYETALVGRMYIFNAESDILSIEVEVTDDDRAQLQQFPVLGHTLDEWARHHVGALHWALSGIMVQPVTRDSQLSQIPEAIRAEISTFSRRTGEIARDAYLAGTKAAAMEILALQREAARRSRGL